MIKSETARSILLVALCSLLIGAYAVADAPKRAINIPAGDLGSALQLLAKQSGADIVYRPEQVKGLRTEGVSGNLSTRQALDVLLKGTMLTLRTDSSGAILITASSPDDSPPTPTKSTPGGKQTIRPSRAKPTENDGPEATNALEEIVVTATKRRESIQDVPMSVTALTGDALEAKGALNFDDYARSVPGLSFMDTGVGRERIAIRGVDATVGSTVVGYYLDETPIPDASAQSLQFSRYRL